MWTKSECEYLRTQIKFKSCAQIAKDLKLKPASVRWKAHKLGLKIPRHIPAYHWNSKHKHLRKKVMEYFLNHTLEETMERFGLTNSEIKSLFTAAYKDPDLKHLRKDRRRKDGWKHKETLFLLRNCGIQSRGWIGKNLKRGGMNHENTNHAIKDRLALMNIGSRYVNGAPLSWMPYLFPGAKFKYIKTKAGPSSQSTDCCLRIIPWVTLELLIDDTAPETIASAVRGLARFQRFIHGMNDPKKIARRLFEQSRKN